MQVLSPVLEDFGLRLECVRLFRNTFVFCSRVNLMNSLAFAILLVLSYAQRRIGFALLRWNLVEHALRPVRCVRSFPWMC